jgi:hypothetical protein
MRTYVALNILRTANDKAAIACEIAPKAKAKATTQEWNCNTEMFVYERNMFSDIGILIYVAIFYRRTN